MTTPEAIPQPANPDAHDLHPVDVVENTFIRPDRTEVDQNDRMITREFLYDRFVQEPTSLLHVVEIPTGRSLPWITRVPNGTKEVTKIRDGGDWIISPKVSAAVILGTLVLANTAAIGRSIINGADNVSHDIYRVFNPVPKVKHVKIAPGKTITVEAAAGQTKNAVGDAAVDRKAVTSFLTAVEAAKAKGDRITSVTITGRTSDEWSNDASIGVKDSDNARLGKARAENTATTVQQELAAKGISIKVAAKAQEHVISAVEKQKLEVEAHAVGFVTLKEAIRAVDQGQTVAPELAKEIKAEITDQRGATLKAIVDEPGKEKKIVTYTDGHDNPPKHGPIDWEDEFLPLPPIRRLRRVHEERTKKRFAFIPSYPLFKREVVREDLEHAWIRLRPEALQDDNTLVARPWAQTRTFEHLMRDDRVKDVLKADFQNSKGEDKTIRLMFIDKTPAPETVEAFTTLLTKFASMQDGKLADRLTGIFIFPSSTAGYLAEQPRRIGSRRPVEDPKRVNMGGDKQAPSNVLGLCTPILELAEIHMPDTFTPEQLEAAFAEYMGPTWTLAHEVAGHGTDITDNQRTLQSVRSRRVTNAHIIRGQTWAEEMNPMQRILKNLPRYEWIKRAEKPIQFDISYAATDHNGEIVTMNARVPEDDPRLPHARTSTIVGRKPSRYAGENVLEHYAETGAAVTTGLTAPYDEAFVDVPLLTTDNGQTAAFETGFRPDVRGQKVFTDTVGGREASYPVEFARPLPVTISLVKPEDDAVIRAEMIRTRKVRMLRPDEMIAILARRIGSKA